MLILNEHPGHRVTSRRAFLAASIAATASPFVAAAEPPTKTWRIGYLGPGTPSASARLLEAFRQGHAELGYAEGRQSARHRHPAIGAAAHG